MRKRTITAVIVGFLLCSSFAQAEMSSTNFQIRWDSISTGGSDTASSASYLLRDTSESGVAGTGSSTNYQLQQGYRAGIDDQIITFEVFAEDISAQRAATALSGTTVTADSSGMSAGDLIAVIQDRGATQVSAIGKVISTGAGTVTVDAWKDGGSAPSIDGTNDVVVPLTSTSLALGELSDSGVGTGIIGFEVTAANDNGYIVQVIEDGNLRTGSEEISDVADGSVSAASEEYGARSSDTSLSSSTFDTADSAITSSFQEIASESSASFESRNFLTLKTGISSSTAAGSYSHTISIIASGNF